MRRRHHSNCIIMRNLWLLVSFLLFLHGASAKRRKKPSDGKNFKNGEIETVCTLKGRADEYLHCVCSDGFPPYHYSTAQCWIFAEISPQDEIWNLFLLQTNLTKLTLMLRPEVPTFAIPTKTLTFLRKLENFTVYFGNIQQLPAFSFPTQLKEIIVSGSGIARIAKHCFYNLPNLYLLQLDDNDITELRQDMFVKLPNLRKLILSKNNISSIQDGTFSHLANLTELRLDSNSLVTLTNLTFKELGHLKILALDNNKFQHFDDFIFEQLWELEVLDLDNNDLTYISIEPSLA
ncbi:hypothetical protein WA026_009949 [Henosepilachna vigintioctopunctata]|uniref:Connectin n=1 Tax=Henosepilachna vigintioctopunctata TaxID=420089 RepID=A0AAW1TV02_9CUCU